MIAISPAYLYPFLHLRQDINHIEGPFVVIKKVPDPVPLSRNHFPPTNLPSMPFQKPVADDNSLGSAATAMTAVTILSECGHDFPFALIKDSQQDHPEGVKPQGRAYSKIIAELQPSAIKIDEVLAGVSLATIAETSDVEGAYDERQKADPWLTEAIKTVCGSENEARKTLPAILKRKMGLELDVQIEVNGAKGYIAHDDETIVLAFSRATPLKDGLANLDTDSTSKDWYVPPSPEDDDGVLAILQRMCIDGYAFGGETKPKVHSGFFESFSESLPLIRQHIDPLLTPDQPKRKLFVVGSSLGAGVATLATCYFILEHDWTILPHKLVSVTAGGPRACQNSLAEIVEKKLDQLRPLNKAVVCRVVNATDVVPSLPPASKGFKHVGKLVYLSEDGSIMINPRIKHSVKHDDLMALLENLPQIDKTDSVRLSSIATIPKPLQDHFLEFYLLPLLDANGTPKHPEVMETKKAKKKFNVRSLSFRKRSTVAAF